MYIFQYENESHIFQPWEKPLETWKKMRSKRTTFVNNSLDDTISTDSQLSPWVCVIKGWPDVFPYPRTHNHRNFPIYCLIIKNVFGDYVNSDKGNAGGWVFLIFLFIREFVRFVGETSCQRIYAGNLLSPQ